MFTVTLCQDCAIYAANNDDTGCDEAWHTYASKRFLSHLAPDASTEHYSDTRCDGCENALYGARMEATDMWPTMAYQCGKRDAAASGLTVAERAEVDPLSGEWAGDLTPRALFTRVSGISADEYTDADYAGTLDALCEAYEAGYYA